MGLEKEIRWHTATINGNKCVSVGAVAEALGVSKATARRYLDAAYVKINEEKVEFKVYKNNFSGHRYIPIDELGKLEKITFQKIGGEISEGISTKQFVGTSTVAKALGVSESSARRYLDAAYVEINKEKVGFEVYKNNFSGHRYISTEELERLKQLVYQGV